MNSGKSSMRKFAVIAIVLAVAIAAAWAWRSRGSHGSGGDFVDIP